jgi:hypothetical protein
MEKLLAGREAIGGEGNRKMDWNLKRNKKNR